jgi:opacity protein-like surface antigen
MKKILLLLVFLFPVVLYAQSDGVYPWQFQAFVGGASLCDQIGCFGPSGLSIGGSFGRAMGDRWSFELDGAYVGTTEILATRFDEVTGTYYTPELDRTRIWGGGTFLAKMKKFSKGDFHIAIGFVGGYERKSEVTPPGIFHFPSIDNGIKGGLSAGAGMHYWFSENWAFRPEVRFYAVVGNLSGLRYTGGIVRKF